LQVPAGWIAERYGPRRVLYWANFLWSVLTAATPLGNSVVSFVGLRLLLGVGQSADWPSSIVAIRRWFPQGERGKGNSVLLGALYLGPIAAAPATTAVILQFGWRAAFYIFGTLGLLLGAAWWNWFRDRPSQHPRITSEEVAHIAAGQAHETTHTPLGAIAACLGSIQFWSVGLQYFFLIMIQSFYVTWLPTYLVSERHMSLAAMGIYASLPWAAMFCSVFATGWAADEILRRTQSIWITRVPLAIAGFVISAIALIVASRSPDVITMMVLLCISLAAIGMTQVSIWSTVQDLGSSSTGLLSGWTNFWGSFAGVVGPILMAFLVTWTGSWAGALLGIALSAIAGAILWLFVRPQRPLLIGL
jgi:ACS family glucarate transporter-like MFS transporter